MRPSDGKPGFWRLAAELRQHVERLGAERVASILAVPVEALEPLLAGRVELSPKALRRLREAER